MNKSTSQPNRRLLFCMNHIVMGGLEKVLCQYLLMLGKIDGTTCGVVSAHRVTDKYFLEFFAKHNITLIDNVLRPTEKRPDMHFFLRKLIDKLRRKINTAHNIRALGKIAADYDVVIDFANFYFAKQLRHIPIPTIGYCHGSIRFFDRCFNERIADNYDKIVCLTDAFRRDFISRHPRHADKIVRIYNPIDDKYILAAAENSDETPHPQRPYFIAIQRLTHDDKDVETIIRAFEKFHRNHNEYTLYIVGDGPRRRQLESITTNKNIIFTGRIAAPYYLIKNAVGLILSSTAKIGEGFGLVLLEAMVLDTVAISSDVPSGPAEILMNGRGGYLFRPHDDADLANVMNTVANNPKRNAEIIKTAHQNLGRFDARNIVKDFINLVDATMADN